MCAASGGLYDVPGCGTGTADNAITVRRLGTSGAYMHKGNQHTRSMPGILFSLM